MGKLDGKTAVLTGASYGMALAGAKRLAEEGAFVFITGREKERLGKAVAALGKNAAGVQADSAKPADLDRLFDQVRRERGKVDILFASAGVGELNVPLASITEEHVRRIFDTNVNGTIFTVQKAVALMPEGGSIILNGSIAAVKGFAGGSVYSASKAAVRSLGRVWAAELVSRKIRVNTIHPGPIDTGVFERAPKEMKDGFSSIIPMKRMGLPGEIGAAVLFLASDESSFITGSELFVDGGTAQF